MQGQNFLPAGAWLMVCSLLFGQPNTKSFNPV